MAELAFLIVKSAFVCLKMAMSLKINKFYVKSNARQIFVFEAKQKVEFKLQNAECLFKDFYSKMRNIVKLLIFPFT